MELEVGIKVSGLGCVGLRDSELDQSPAGSLNILTVTPPKELQHTA